MSRPTRKRTADEAAQQEQSESRLELDVITGSLWQPTCQALDPVPSKIPLVFDDESHYRRTFEPLLMEEARGSLRAELDEAIGANRGWAVTVTRCAPAKDGVFNLTLRPGDWGHVTNLREGAIVVLIRPTTMTDSQQQQGQQGQGQGQGAGPGPGSLAAMARAAVSSSSAGRWQQQQQQPGGGGGGASSGPESVAPMLAGLVRMRCRDAGQALEVSVRPCCGREAHRPEGSPCNRALHMMIGSGVTTEADDGSPEPTAAAAAAAANGGGGGGPGGGSPGPGGGPLWLWLVPLTSLITNVRELRVLQRLGDIALLPELLRPAGFGAAGAAELPQDARHEPYYKYLYSQYDTPQREAIVAAAAHLATPEDLAEAEAQGIATGGSGGAAAAAAGLAAARAAAAAGGTTRPLVPPITLVQGPPGTGKTHTVRGILNTWHSIMYHRHHTAWLRRARDILTRSAASARGGGGGGGSLLDMYCDGGGVGNGGAGGVLEALSAAPPDAPKPRILVCAPSNAATDELLDRILTDGFCDFGGAIYRPNVVRVGAEEAPLSDAVKAVWTEAMMNRYEAMGPEAWAVAYKDCEARIANCNVYMAAMATKMASRGGGGGAAAAAAGEGPEGSQELDRMAGELVRLNDCLNRAREEMARLDRMGDLATSGPQRLPGYVVRRIREDLELSLMEEAEMVFTTLSSTGRAVFSRLGRGFDFVLIDEAAQASEIAALQPLLYGCRRLVMVGDPQQLPATLFSAAAKETLLERSLFERLAQAGMAVKMLSVQYRMHPEIRTFPSSYFYGNRLADGESVARAAAAPPPYYAADLLKPYVVYDVSGGREWLQGRSRSNEAEAELALGLYLELLATVRNDPGVGAAAADAAAAAAGGASGAGGGRGLREPTPPGGGRAASVERSLGGGGSDPAAAQQQQQAAFSCLAGYTLGVSVGIITPYRAQRELIRRKFVEALGPGVLEAVRIETVDSFQGKQLDVIILSCVRTVRPGAPPPSATAGSGGVGFLADVRRMNVAITRAKQALWVLGHFAALGREPAWAALLADAQERECVIREAAALELCPQWEAFLERQRANANANAAAARAQQQQQAEAGTQQRFGPGPGSGGGVLVAAGPSGAGFGSGPGPGPGQMAFQQQPLPPPGALQRPGGPGPDWSQAAYQALGPPRPPPGRPQLLQSVAPPGPGPGPGPGAGQGFPQSGMDGASQQQQLLQPQGGADAAAPLPQQRRTRPPGAARGGGGGRGGHRPRSLNQLQFHNAPPQLQPQPLAGQQQQQQHQGAGRGRGALASMLPKHGRGSGRGGRGQGSGRGAEVGQAAAPEQ
ncbi:hypothetical protein PLESTB_000447300 [Pleodorina starrii]|uniref:Uncharacterized protein n=1 Tax=Pleodorina starrii TaxID=330485 RepID=A0A9W6F097_9CHLO|nr:hypothetical protein PLESTB_000447300 [Pleodorina starrii]